MADDPYFQQAPAPRPFYFTSPQASDSLIGLGQQQSQMRRQIGAGLLDGLNLPLRQRQPNLGMGMPAVEMPQINIGGGSPAPLGSAPDISIGGSNIAGGGGGGQESLESAIKRAAKEKGGIFSPAPGTFKPEAGTFKPGAGEFMPSGSIQQVAAFAGDILKSNKESAAQNAVSQARAAAGWPE